MERKKVAILYGGRSVEHGVSVNSARNIFEYIDKKRFDPLPIGISTKGEWFLTSGVSKDVETGKPLSLQLNAVRPSWSAEGQSFTPDILFPVLHGTDGEDGSVQGLLQAVDLPFVGTGVLGSAVSMNKLTAKRLLKQAGLPVSDYLAYHNSEKNKITFDEVVAKLGLPFMVKATSLGSSVGVSKVKGKDDFDHAINDAFAYGDDLLIERFIRGREIECAILGNDPPQASLPGEIVISSKYEFYTFDAKYVDGDAVKIEVPAKLSAEAVENIRAVSVKAFQALHCQDFARVDLFLKDEKEIYINEINTIPGFTNSSMYPMMWKERGISFMDLISKLIDLALDRYDKSKRIERGYSSSLKY
jgi:D-alanine-D-alanine ligase